MTSSVPGVGPGSPRDAPRLRVLNLVMAGLHLLQGLAMVSLASAFALPVTAAFVGFEPSTESLKSQFETLFDLRLAPLVAGFLFLSALAHLAVSLPGIYPWYRQNLDRRVNYARWIEYAFSSSLMVVLIGMLPGVFDVAAIIAIFGVNASMLLFGLLGPYLPRGEEGTQRPLPQAPLARRPVERHTDREGQAAFVK